MTHIATFLVGGWLVGWLNWFNAELSPERYFRGPRSHEVEEEGDYTQRYTVDTTLTPALRRAAIKASLMFH